MLEKTAFIACWKPGGKAQLGYVKEITTRALIANEMGLNLLVLLNN